MKTVTFGQNVIISMILNFQILCINATSGESKCKDIEGNSVTLRLKRHLFCDYDRGVRPTFHFNRTTVTMRLMPKFIEFDDRSNILNLHSWMIVYWKDDHLTWNQKDFDGVENINIRSSDIWIPDLYVYNSGDSSYDQNGIPETDCVLTHDGYVSCVPTIKYIFRCVADYRNWPFDKQNCTARLGSWTHLGEEIDFRFSHSGISLEDYKENKEWNLNSVDALIHVKRFECCADVTFPTIYFHFILERHTSIMTATYVTPAIFLIIITLMVLVLDPKSTERMIIASINFICHLLCMQDLHWLLPFNGANAPRILLFYRDSLILSGFTIFLTGFLRQLQVINMPAPGWLSSSTTFVLESRAGQIFLFSILDPKASAKIEAGADDNAGLLRPAMTTILNGETTWIYVTTFIGRLSFIGVLLTYIVMLLNLIPTVVTHDADTAIATDDSIIF